MGLDKIREAVLSEAKSDAGLMVERARKHTAALLDAKKEEAAREFERIFKTRAAAVEDELSRRLIQFKGVAAKEVLERRNALLRSLFEKAREAILAWPAERYGQVMSDLAEKAAGASPGRLRVHSSERDLFEQIVVGLNAGRGEGRKISIDQREYLQERGGFIFVADDYEIDQTLSTMLKDIEQEMLPQVAAHLFRK